MSGWSYAQQVKPCSVPDHVSYLDYPLPSITQAFHKNQTLRIVALGSSSTQGTGASSPSHSYPSRLEAHLRARFPKHNIDVLNHGIGGELATDMLARLDKDVLAHQPVLVIWQTGINDVIRNVDITAFRKTVISGIDRMKQAGIDVILMDQQYYPGARKISNFLDYVSLIEAIAKETQTPLIRRYALMKHLVTSGQFKINDLLAKDQFHLNDVSYACLREVIAGVIVSRLLR